MASQAPSEATADSPAAAQGGGWLSGANRWIVAGAALATILGLSLALLVALRPSSSEPAEDESLLRLADALAALDEQRHDRAAHVARVLLRNAALEEAEAGGPAFVLGVVTSRQAGAAPPSERATLRREAIAWLEESQELGFPEAREAEALLHWGQNLVLLGRYLEALPRLAQALELDPGRSLDVRPLLLEAQMRQPDPNWAACRAEAEQLLVEPKLSDAARATALVQQYEILIRLGQVEAAEQLRGQLPAQLAARPEVATLDGLRLWVEAHARPEPERAPVLTEAIERLSAAVDAAQAAGQPVTAARYLRGLCWQRLDRADEAVADFDALERDNPRSPELFAIRVERARRLLEDGETDSMLRQLDLALGALDAEADYSNPWLPLRALQTRLLDAYDRLGSQRQFAEQARLASLLPRAMPPDRAYDFWARAEERWAADLTEQAERLPLAEAAPLEEQARARWRAAGNTSLKLAKVRFATDHYTDDLWSAAEAMRKGRDFDTAIRVLREFVQYESRPRRVQGLVNLAEALAARQQADEAAALARQCVEFYPRHPACSEARLLLAGLYVERNELSAAEAILRANLDSDYLSPASPEWRQSLLALGRVLQHAGRLDEAILVFDEALERYPDDPQQAETRYLAALTHQRLAHAAEQGIAADTLLDDRAALERTSLEHREAALELYEQILSAAAESTLAERRNPTFPALVRNTFFARAAALFDLRRYADAIQAYQQAAQRYQDAPEALDALLQISACYRRLDKPLEARTTLEQARLLLERLPRDADFLRTTNFDREGWDRVLSALSSL